MRIAIVAAALLMSRLAAAQAGYPPGPPGDPPPAPPGWTPVAPAAYQAPTPPHRVFSLTISPLHFFLPVVELTAELRAHDKVGVALVGGAGKITDKTANISATAYEVGGQLRFYALGDFRHGMMVGAEALYAHLSDSNVSLTGQGLAVGPFLGYKVISDPGFTFDTQLGAQYMAVRATDGVSAASDDQFIVLLNLNIGWSF